MKTKLTHQEQEIVRSNPSLQRYLQSLLVGRKATPRSWLYEQKSTDQVLVNWKAHLSTLENGSIFERNVYAFDTSQEEKWGPQGEVKPISELEDVVLAGFGNSPIPKAFSSNGWAKAKEQVVHSLRSRIRGLRPASYQTVVNSMRARSTLESNSGWPLFTRRNNPEAIKSSIRDAEDGTWRDYPAIALFRNYNQKTRLVWMFPMSANLVEGSYFLPVQQALTKELGTSFLAPWVGFEPVRDLITRSYDAGKFVAASDFSATDAHFRLAASLEVFDVIAPLFQARYAHGLRESLVHMHTIPLVVGPDSKLVGDHGVSSGSNWTNFIETIFDLILSVYVGSAVSGTTGLFGIGDDMAWQSNSYDEEFPSILEEYGHSVGQDIKAEKTTNERDKVKSLQRLFQRGYKRPDGKCRAVYSTIRALKSSVFPERFHNPRDWNSDMFCARQFMILENCVDHPLFEEFVKFVCLGQRDLIPFAKKSRSELDRILRESRLLPGLNPTYNQERKDQSFANFSSVRFAASL